MFCTILRKVPVLESLFNKIAGLQASTFRPTTLLKKQTQLFSCEYCETFKNIYFEEHLKDFRIKKITEIYYY